MRGTDFGGIHSYTDLHLIQQSVEVEPAAPKLNLVEIPGADGSRDLSTQPAGRVVFKDRKITWTFALYPGENWELKHSEVSNHLNGLECKITLDSDPGYYYKGRLAVKKYKRDGLLRQITVEATCRPYKLKQKVTTVNGSLTTTYKTFTLVNDRRPVVPTITVSAATTIKYSTKEYALAAGTHTLLDIQLGWGNNPIQAKVASGTGTLKIEYQEGAL